VKVEVVVFKKGLVVRSKAKEIKLSGGGSVLFLRLGCSYCCLDGMGILESRGRDSMKKGAMRKREE